MAKPVSVPSKHAKLVLVGANGAWDAHRVQRLSIDTNIPVTTIDEIGNSSHAGITKDRPENTLTFSLFDVGIKAISALTGKNPNAFPASGVGIDEIQEIDAVVFTKDEALGQYSKSMHLKRLMVNTINFNYSVDGEATEEYTASVAEKRFLRYSVIVDRFVSGTTSFTLSQTPLQLKNGNYALSVIVDGQYLKEVSTTPGAGEYRISGTTLTLGTARTNYVLAIYHANSPVTWVDVSDTTVPAAIRGKDVAVRLSANSIPRVQSVSITATLNTTPVMEMGNRDVVGYNKQVPQVEGSITVLDTDHELVNLLTTGSTSSSDVEWQPGTGCTTSGISLTIELLDPCDTSASPTVLKTVYLDSVEVVGDSYTVNVNDNAQQVFNFRSTTGRFVVYSGAKP